MFKRIIAAALVFATAPAAAEETDQHTERLKVRSAVDAFFDALRSPDKTVLAETMIQEAVIFVHDRRDPAQPTVRIVPAGEHLAGWEQTPPGTDEIMHYTNLQLDGSMAHVWGPYVFLVNGAPTHCGINSMSLARFPDKGWKVTNTSFTMTSLDECDALNAPSFISTAPTSTP